MNATDPAGGGVKAPKKLGRKVPTDGQRRRAVPLRNFLKLEGRVIPATDDYATKAKAALRQMMNNDREGCCVSTALAKWLGLAVAEETGGAPIVATDKEVSLWYHAVGGPGDNGLVMVEAYEYLMRRGMVIGGKTHKIEGYAAVDTTDGALLDAAFHWFGGIGVGVSLTQRQYENADDDDVWDDDGGRVVGGHMVPLTARDAAGFKLATWAREPRVTRRCVQSRRWCDEAYVALGPDWYGEDKIDVNKVNVDALTAAMAAIRAGGTPDIPNDPNPPAPPGPGGDIWSFDRTWELFGYGLHLHLGLHTGAALVSTRGLNWLKLVQDVWALARAISQRDWYDAPQIVLDILGDLGIHLGDDAPEIARRIADGMRGKTLTDGR